jgi:hypothetical protein
MTAAPFERGMPAATAVTVKWLSDLAIGKLDRSQLNPDFNAFMTPQRVALSAKSLARFGPPKRARVTYSRMRGGLIANVLDVEYKDRTLRAILYREPSGHIAELLVFPQ